LELLAPYREFVYSSRKLTWLMEDELRERTPAIALVQEDATQFLRTILGELDRGETTTLREVVDGPVATLMPASRRAWSEHGKHKQQVREIYNGIKAVMSADELKALRQSPKKRVSDWLSSRVAAAFVFQGLKSLGLDDATAYEFTRTPNVTTAFLTALAGLAVYWLAFGGFESASPEELSSDLIDMPYVVLGSMSHSFASADRRASLICDAVSRAIESRRCLPQPAD
jgi:hypothetical protein